MNDWTVSTQLSESTRKQAVADAEFALEAALDALIAWCANGEVTISDKLIEEVEEAVRLHTLISDAQAAGWQN